MSEKVIDERKLLIVIICRNEAELQRQRDSIKPERFIFPRANAFKAEFLMTIKDRSLAITCNNVRKDSDAKYFIFLTTPATDFDSILFAKIFEIFFAYPKVGIVGLMGSEMPLSGNPNQAKNIYGSYFYKDGEKDIQHYGGKIPLLYQSVHVVDSGFFATSQDIAFDEDISDDFFSAAQCCRYRRAGYDVGVMYMEGRGLIFSEDRCIYRLQSGEEYEQRLNIFYTRYKDVILPLVSICIPTYNQPRFFEMALQSALTQTYQNIEIIVGDDSTNEDTKKMIEPYLREFRNIKYFYHGGPLGKRGLTNTRFTINHSSGEYINVLFHDDALNPEKIFRMMEYFTRDLEKKIVLTTSARFLIDENNQIIRRMNPWQPSENTILNGTKVGRRILFSKENFIGELSTVLFKRESLLVKDFDAGKNIFDIGVFCGVRDAAYGDFGTWLNLLKSGGECVFIKDCLSAFRQHSAQNTFDPFVMTRCYVEMMSYITIAWLNNVFLRDWDEYKCCCRYWTTFAGDYGRSAFRKITDEMRFLRSVLKKFSDFIAEDRYSEVLDCSIRFLLATLPDNNSIRPLVRKNKETGLWEKVGDGVMLLGEQRC